MPVYEDDASGYCFTPEVFCVPIQRSHSLGIIIFGIGTFSIHAEAYVLRSCGSLRFASDKVSILSPNLSLLRLFWDFIGFSPNFWDFIALFVSQFWDQIPSECLKLRFERMRPCVTPLNTLGRRFARAGWGQLAKYSLCGSTSAG
jgi:hypothetical protein